MEVVDARQVEDNYVDDTGVPDAQEQMNPPLRDDEVSMVDEGALQLKTKVAFDVYIYPLILLALSPTWRTDLWTTSKLDVFELSHLRRLDVLEELLEEDSVHDEVDIKNRDGAALTLTR
eukprot:scaffold687_cov288-Chaetoceros_neogracile.AAC.31